MYTEVIPSVWEVVYIQQLGQLYFIIAYGGSLYSYCGPTNLITTKDVPLLVQNKYHVRKMCSFDQVPLPPSVYLADVIHMIKW